MLDAHPRVAITPESHWITEYEKAGLALDGLVTDALVDRLKRSHWFGLLDITDNDLDALLDTRPQWQYAAFVTAIFDLYGRRHGKPLVGDKTPSYVRSVRTLHRLFPRARLVHIIRDGRDVTLSLHDWSKAPRVIGRFSTWHDDPVSTCALWWEWSVRRGREATAVLPRDRRHEVRYETLTGRPDEATKKLCDFLGIDYHPEMLEFHQGRERSEPQLDAKSAWRPITRGLRSWRDQMPVDQLERFEAVAGDLLDELHYPRAHPHIGTRAKRRARQLRDQFTDDAHEQHSPVPKHWY